MYRLKTFLLLLYCCSALAGFAQTDSNVVVVDSTLRNPDAKRNPIFNAPKDSSANLKVAEKVAPVIFKDSARLALEALPRIASRRSAILPGWGQVTNGRWWKVPAVYGGFVGVGLVFEFNNRYYKKFLDELQYRDANNGEKLDPDLLKGDTPALIQYKDYYRRNRDLSVLIGVGWYAVNIIDAYIDAKFFRFDISDKLGFSIKPSLVPPHSFAFNSPAPAIKIQIKL